jgi:DNA modification methylase
MSLLWNEYVLGDAFPYLALIPNQSVDLVFTSMPDLSQTPYSQGDVDGYRGFQKTACEEFSRIVKDKGFVVICQTDRRMDGGILCNHVWYIQCLTSLGLRVKDEKIVVRNEVGRIDMYHLTYQYLTVFSRKGSWKRAGDILQDIIVDKQVKTVPNQPTWSFDFCKRIIEAFSPEGGTVIDPFAASAPVLYAASKLNRQWWGAEIEPERYNKDFHLFEMPTGDGLFES